MVTNATKKPVSTNLATSDKPAIDDSEKKTTKRGKPKNGE